MGRARGPRAARRGAVPDVAAPGALSAAARTPEHELLRLLAATAERREARREHAIALARRCDPAALVEALRTLRLETLLGSRLLALLDDPPPPLAQAVAAALERSRPVAAVQELLTLRLLGALDAAGVRAAPLKGPLLAAALHGEAAMRDSTDLDLLVDAGALDRAVAEVERLGWERWYPSRDVRLPLLHVELAHPRGLPPVEIHWRVHWYEREAAGAMLARAARAPDAGWRLQPADELATLLLFYARDGFTGLRFPADVAAWWDLHGGAAAPLAGFVAEHPRLARAIVAGAQLAEEVVGVPAAGIVGPGAGLRPRARLAFRLADPFLTRSREQRAADVSLVDALLAPRTDLGRFVSRQLLLPASEVRHRHPEARSPGGARLEHALKTVARYGISARHIAASGAHARPPVSD